MLIQLLSHDSSLSFPIGSAMDMGAIIEDYGEVQKRGNAEKRKFGEIESDREIPEVVSMGRKFISTSRNPYPQPSHAWIWASQQKMDFEIL